MSGGWGLVEDGRSLWDQKEAEENGRQWER